MPKRSFDADELSSWYVLVPNLPHKPELPALHTLVLGIEQHMHVVSVPSMAMAPYNAASRLA